MNSIQLIMFIFILAFLSTIFFTFFVRKILRDADIRDSPIVSEHRHKTGTPTMGGIAFLLGILFVSFFYFGYSNHNNLILTAMIMATAGLVGLMDDLIGLKIKYVQKLVRNIVSQPVPIGRLTLQPGEEARVTTPQAKKDLKNLLKDEKLKIIGEVPIKNEVKEREKIFAQILISVFLIVSGAVSTSVLGFNAGLLIIPVVIFGIIGSINAVNLIDGLDGLAAGILAISSSACAIFSYTTGNLEGSITFIAISGLCFGFLVFNRYPASIFMGDTGSFALGAGYITAAFLGDIIYFAVIALAIPILSVIVSLLHRAHIIKLPVEPLHHTLQHKGLSEKKIIILYWVITILICTAAIFFYKLF